MNARPWIFLALWAIAGIRPGPVSAAEPAPRPAAPSSEVVSVHRRVADFPALEDLSTPAAAYAAIHRAWAAEGDAAWRRLSLPRLADRLPRATAAPLPAARAAPLLGAEIVEVHLWGQTNAVVIARMTNINGRSYMDLRLLACWNGRWLNTGNDMRSTLEEARQKAAQLRAYHFVEQLRLSRPIPPDPDARLRQLTDFLEREGADPVEFLQAALEHYRIVILGEVHHRPSYWALNAAWIQRPAFARRAGVIYLELPAHNQPLIDRYLEEETCVSQLAIDTLRDMLWMGWPDQSMLDFLQAVWEVNRALPIAQRLRVVLVDMPRPWREIRQRGDWARFEVDRDRFMADQVDRDQREHASDPRHALFIVGYGHAMLDLTEPGGEPMRSAGWYLRQRQGESNVFAVFPHGPVMTNSGRVGGRLARGLFDSAFAALGNRPLAFPLDHGPFGEEWFDADPERLTADPYRRGYQAYLYLGPLEQERFSPLIPGFYTDDFVQELDRRCRVTFGRGIREQCGLAEITAAAFEKWMGADWGQPRRAWRQLGPIDAWRNPPRDER